jgi:hypothetical protein
MPTATSLPTRTSTAADPAEGKTPTTLISAIPGPEIFSTLPSSRPFPALSSSLSETREVPQDRTSADLGSPGFASKGEDASIELLIVAIVCMVIFGVVFSLLIYKENEVKQLELKKQSEEAAGKVKAKA